MEKKPDEIAEMCSGVNFGAFDLMVEQYGARLNRFIYSLTFDSATADDLVQETFLKAFAGIGTYRPGTNFESWLRKIAVNLFIDGRRAENRRSAREKKYSADAQLQDCAAGSVERSAVRNENAEEIRGAVMSLPEKQRTAIALFTWGDASISEIAGIMKCSEGGVMSHLHRARRALRDRLKNIISSAELES